MEKEDFGPQGDRVYVCSECFGELSAFMLTNPNLLKLQGLPANLRAVPLEQGRVEPCEKCNTNVATGYIPCSNKMDATKKREEKEK